MHFACNSVTYNKYMKQYYTIAFKFTQIIKSKLLQHYGFISYSTYFVETVRIDLKNLEDLHANMDILISGKDVCHVF